MRVPLCHHACRSPLCPFISVFFLQHQYANDYKRMSKHVWPPRGISLYLGITACYYAALKHTASCSLIKAMRSCGKSRRLQLGFFFLYYNILVNFRLIHKMILNVTSVCVIFIKWACRGICSNLAFICHVPIFTESPHRRTPVNDAVLSLLDGSSPGAVVPISTADQPLKIPVFHRRSGTLARVNY